MTFQLTRRWPSSEPKMFFASLQENFCGDSKCSREFKSGARVVSVLPG